MQNKTMNLRNMVLIAMLGAIAFILMYLEIPLPFIAPAFYEMDFSAVPVLIGAFAMGPGAGVAIEFLKILLHTLLRGTSTAYVGEIANFVVGCALVVPAGLLYRRKKTRGHALAGMALGTLLMVTAGSLINAYVLLPWYANHFFAGAGGKGHRAGPWAARAVGPEAQADGENTPRSAGRLDRDPLIARCSPVAGRVERD